MSRKTVFKNINTILLSPNCVFFFIIKLYGVLSFFFLPLIFLSTVDAIGSLSVVHIHNEDTWEFLSPNKISTTHIAVNVCRLSRYGIVHENNQNNKIINGQVLLFQEPEMSPTQQRLWVFLLPSNVPLSEVG